MQALATEGALATESVEDGGPVADPPVPGDLASEFGYREVQFSRLPARTSTHKLTVIEAKKSDGDSVATHLLVGTHSTETGKVVCVTVKDSRWATQEVAFSYIPLDAEVISIDSFNRDGATIVGVAIAKTSANEPESYFLNVYGASRVTGQPFDLEALASDCQRVAIPFAPYQLTHATMTDASSNKATTAFVLGGSDGRVHLYVEDRASHEFLEQPLSSFVPELEKITLSRPSCFASQDGIVAVGCHEGTLSLIVGAGTPASSVTSVTMDSTISFAVLFSDKLARPFDAPSALDRLAGIEPRPANQSNDAPVHLLVGSALDGAFVYDDIVRNGLSVCTRLPDSDAYDVVVCGHAMDFDCDGSVEVLVGTYGQQLLVYKRNEQGFSLFARRSFTSPLYQLHAGDVTKDGMDELIVTSLSGIHFLQYNLSSARERCLRVLGLLAEIEALKRK